MAFPASNDKHKCSSKELQFRRVMYRIAEKCRMTGPVLDGERGGERERENMKILCYN
jgi:hypothetical protein